MRSCKFLGMESQVVATVGAYHTLIVNRKGEMYITSRADYFPASMVQHL
jgi:hypothetical protein